MEHLPPDKSKPLSTSNTHSHLKGAAGRHQRKWEACILGLLSLPALPFPLTNSKCEGNDTGRLPNHKQTPNMERKTPWFIKQTSLVLLFWPCELGFVVRNIFHPLGLPAREKWSSSAVLSGIEQNQEIANYRDETKSRLMSLQEKYDNYSY